MHDAGFYSVVTETIKCISILLKDKIVPVNIDFSSCFSFYKHYPQQNGYPFYFKLNSEITDIGIGKNINFISSNHPAERIKLTDNHHNIVEKYFSPSYDVDFYRQYFERKYKIDINNTICVFYRGTDKWMEMPLVHPKFYLGVVNKILKDHPNCKVLVQTDQTQIKKYFKDKLKEKFLSFDELPTTERTDVGFHQIITENSIDKVKFAIMFDAAVRCISKCKYIVCSPGNVSLMMRMYRKTCNGMYTFGANRLIYKYNGIYYDRCLSSGQITECPT